jgi:hypothetical protein
LCPLTAGVARRNGGENTIKATGEIEKEARNHEGKEAERNLDRWASGAASRRNDFSEEMERKPPGNDSPENTSEYGYRVPKNLREMKRWRMPSEKIPPPRKP